MSSLWDFDVHKEEILDFSKNSHKDWVEVDSDKSLGSLWSWLSVEEELVKLVLCGLFNSLLPKGNLGAVVVLKVLAKRCIELLNILELFSVLNGLRKNGKLVHWLLDSLEESISPAEGSRDWWQVLEDW